jgi:outer membrane protein TolC
VEDNLAALRILEDEAKQENLAVESAERSLSLATERYKGGVDTYLDVITAEATALTNESAAVDILTRRMTSAVALVQALGGGWDTSQLPAAKELVAKKP